MLNQTYSLYLRLIILFIYIQVISNSSYSSNLLPHKVSNNVLWDGFERVDFKNIPFNELQNFLQIKLNIDGIEIKEIMSYKDEGGGTIHTFYQIINGIKIDQSPFYVCEKDGIIHSIKGTLYRYNRQNNLSFSLNKARRLAIKSVNARIFRWENQKEEMSLKIKSNNINSTYFPNGEVVYVPKKNKSDIQIVYKFTIESFLPKSKHTVYVDAIKGKLISSIKSQGERKHDKTYNY